MNVFDVLPALNRFYMPQLDVPSISLCAQLSVKHAFPNEFILTCFSCFKARLNLIPVRTLMLLVIVSRYFPITN